jgi:hypothetical protein
MSRYGWSDYLRGRGGFTLALLAAVSSVAVFAFLVDADAHLTILLLGLGLVTAFAESRSRLDREGD